MNRPQTETEARREANKLTQRLERAFGVKWNTHVWYDLGWTYMVSYGHLKVHSRSWHSGERRYYTSLGISGGRSEWTDNFSSDNPVRAVLHQLRIANRHLQELHQLVLDSIPIKRSGE